LYVPFLSHGGVYPDDAASLSAPLWEGGDAPYGAFPVYDRDGNHDAFSAVLYDDAFPRFWSEADFPPGEASSPGAVDPVPEKRPGKA